MKKWAAYIGLLPSLLFSLIFVSGCTIHQPKYNVGDVITNTEGGPCYGFLIERYDEPFNLYYFKNVTRCNTTNTSQWKYVGDDPWREDSIKIDFNPLISKIDHLDNINGIPGPYRTIK